MKFVNTSVNTAPEILKVHTGSEYTKPITIASGALTSGICKAGTPIGEDGAVANSAAAVGILLNDVTADNPNGTILCAYGVVNTANANANAGLVIDEAVKTALPLLVFA